MARISTKVRPLEVWNEAGAAAVMAQISTKVRPLEVWNEAGAAAVMARAPTTVRPVEIWNEAGAAAVMAGASWQSAAGADRAASVPVGVPAGRHGRRPGA